MNCHIHIIEYGERGDVDTFVSLESGASRPPWGYSEDTLTQPGAVPGPDTARGQTGGG